MLRWACLLPACLPALSCLLPAFCSARPACLLSALFCLLSAACCLLPAALSEHAARPALRVLVCVFMQAALG
ncbi:hypothetical protein BC831DRAFT_447285 [Entophlyctis helioformis]|nr:hypothetical protein BC831DRAFT_447285 [Entophlyctis helioformis]